MIRRVLSAGIARFLGALFGFGLSVVVGRNLGAAGAGQFFLAVTIVTLISQVTRFGFPYHLMRLGAVCRDQGSLGPLRPVYVRSLGLATLFATAVGLGMGLGSGWIATHLIQKPDMASLVTVFAVTLVPFTVLWVNAGLFKGIGSAEIANLIEAGMLPALAVGLLLLIGIGDPHGAAIVYLAASAAGAVGSTALVFWKLRHGRPDPATPVDLGMGYGLGTTVVAVTGYLILWLPFMILGRVASDEALGAFSVAQRTVMVIGMVNVVINSVYLPSFSAAHAAGDVRRIRRALRTTALFMVAGTAPFVAAIFVAPHMVLKIFGAGFESGAGPLMILTAASFVSMFFGPADEVLLMFGDTRSLRRITYAVLAVEALAAIALIPSYPLTGAAVITGIALVARRVGSWIIVQTHVRKMAATR